jgi:hypothetical protein
MALLSPDFQFYIRDDDAADLPWVMNGFWSRDVEGEIMEHMMDPNYVGSSPPVQTIEATLHMLSDEVVDGGGPVLVVDTVADADIRVFVDPGTGWFSNTRFECTLERAAPEAMRIRTLREIHRTEPGRTSPTETLVEELSWGGVKALYR